MEERNILLWIIIAAVILLIVFAGTGMWGYGLMGFGMGFGFLFMLLFWGAVIWIVVTLINPAQWGKKDESDPLTILKRRYAKGELTKKEFLELKKELEG